MGYTKFYTPQCGNTSCTLSSTCNRPATVVYRPEFQDEESQVDFLFVGDTSSLSDILSRSCLMGVEGTQIKNVISDFQDRYSFGFVNLIRGWSTEDIPADVFINSQDIARTDERALDKIKNKNFSHRKDKYEIISNCIGYFDYDIKRFRPKKIIALGSSVVSMLFPREKRPVSALMDTMLLYKNIPTFFAQHPYIVLKNPSGKKSWCAHLERIITGKKLERSVDAGRCTLITDYKEAVEYIDALMNTDCDVATDSETKNLFKRYGNKLACLQFADSPEGAVVIPFYHPETPFSPQELESLKSKFFDLFYKPSRIRSWIAHNAKFECNIYATTFGSSLKSAPIFDTQIAAFLLDENRTTRVAEFKYGVYTLKQLALDYLNFDGYDRGILAVRSEGNLFDLNLKDLATYAAMDAVITFRLRDVFLEEAAAQDYLYQLKNLMYNLYTHTIRLFSDIERTGSPVDRTHLRNLLTNDSILLKRMEEINNNLKKNPNVIKANEILLSKQQGKTKVRPLISNPWVFDFAKQGHAQTLFFEVLGLQPGPVGASGLPSVDSTFQDIHSHIPIVAEFTDWALMRKMFDSFAKKLYACVDPTTPNIDHNTDCRIRPDFMLSTVVTGRVACRNPNLQNVPRADNPAKKAIKDIFCALPDHLMVQADFKANEVRWVGIIANDHKLTESFKLGKKYQDEFRKNPTEELQKLAEIYGDIHKVNASKIFNKKIEEVTKDERHQGKQIVLSLIYDKSEYSLAQELNMSKEEIRELIDAFFSQFSSLRSWKQNIKQFAKDYGYVEALHGRRRRFPIFDLYRHKNGHFDDRSVPREVRGPVQEALRQAANSPVQGLASDAAMIGASMLNDWIRENNKPWFIQNAVHDSVICQIPIKDIPYAVNVIEDCLTTKVQEYMATVFDVFTDLPLEVEFEIGKSWGSLEKWDGNPSNLQDLLDAAQT